MRWGVNQEGGLGILERLNCTFKDEFVFRYEVEALDDLKPLAPQFQLWDNYEHLHNSLGYRGPWRHAVADATVPSNTWKEFLGHCHLETIAQYGRMKISGYQTLSDGVMDEFSCCVHMHLL
jgi:hypothetical protein